MVHYLTVQDVLWINHEVARRVNEYKYAQLEEAVFFQYGYGKSEDVIRQAGRFLEGFLKLRPFSSHNVPTAVLSVLTFLQMNGRPVQLKAEKLRDWVDSVASGKVRGADAVIKAVSPTSVPTDIHPPIRTIVHNLMKEYGDALNELEDLAHRAE